MTKRALITGITGQDGIDRTSPNFWSKAGGRVRKGRSKYQDQAVVCSLFEKERPDHVFMTADKTVLFHANNTYLSGVDRLLFLGSSWINLKHSPHPVKGEHLLTASLEPTNEHYGIAKIAGIKMCESYNRQYGTKFVAVMPTNLYRSGDNYNPEKSHVIPALIRRFHEAKESGAKEVVVWGTGDVRREFLHVDDMAEACVFVLSLPDDRFQMELLSYPRPCFVNVGTGRDVTIRELAESVAMATGFDGEIAFDTLKPEGTPRKLLDVRRLEGLGWQSGIKIQQGISGTCSWITNILKHEASKKNLIDNRQMKI